MLLNAADLKPGVKVEDVELVHGEMCNVVKNNYGDDSGGLIGDQVYRNAGFISEEGTVGADDSNKNKRVNQHIGGTLIVTDWQSFEPHERSHADRLF
jgi:hypothetical protein